MRGRSLLITGLTGVSLVVLLVGLGVVVSTGLAPALPPRTEASRFVAADGARGFGTFTAAGQQAPAMVENATLTGSQVVSAVPGGMFARTVGVPGQDATSAHWWRESVVVSGYEEPESRYRLRSVSTDGVRLHGQSWGARGLTFEPALLELPADVAAGRQWRSDGRAVGDADAGLLDYTSTSRAARPPGADGDAGCLQITATTVLTPLDQPTATGASTRWTETELWCPGHGVVADRGNFRGTAFDLARLDQAVPVTLQRAALAPAVPAAGDLSSWRHGELATDDGDPTFGAHPLDLSATGVQAAAASSGTLHVINTGQRDVNILTPLTNGRFWALGWLHPGSEVTSVQTVGGLVVLTTADRRLMGYDFGGRLRWSTTLPEVSVVTPRPTAGERILVATLGGQVGSYDALTGQRQWQHDLQSAVIAELATGGGVGLVVDSDSQLHALDLADGHELWTTGVPTAGADVAVVGDRVITHTYAHLTALDLRTGRIVWEHTGLGDTQAMHVVGDVAVLLLTDQTRGYAGDDGRLLWTRRGAALDAVAFGGSDFMLTPSAIVALDAHGGERRRWPLGVTLGSRARLVTGAAQLWAIGQDADGLRGVWIGDREPGQ